MALNFRELIDRLAYTAARINDFAGQRDIDLSRVVTGYEHAVVSIILVRILNEKKIMCDTEASIRVKRINMKIDSLRDRYMRDVSDDYERYVNSVVVR